MSNLLAFLFGATLCTSGLADDWPQWMGKNRDNRWEAINIIDRFPTGGPKVVWRAKVDGGYSGPAVVGDRVYVTDFVAEGDVKVDNFNRATCAGKDRVLCLDATTTQLMSHPAGATHGRNSRLFVDCQLCCEVLGRIELAVLGQFFADIFDSCLIVSRQ